MERWREDFHQKGKIYQHGVFSWCNLRDTEASRCHVALKSQNACTNQLASSILFECLSPSFRTGSSYQKF